VRNKGKFKEFYEYGISYGKGEIGEVRQCKNRSTGIIRAVRIINQDALEPEEKFRLLFEIEIMK